MTNAFSLGKTIKKDTGSSKTSTEVKKPTGVKIKTEVEAVKPKVSILPLYLISPFDLDSEYLIFNFVFYFQSRKRNISAETVSTASKKSKQTIVLDTKVSTAHD
jgi:hypothetical protein